MDTIISRSEHIDYSQQLRTYHKVIGRLVQKYVNPDGKLLDVGCGVGNMLEYIDSLEVRYRMYAADVDEHCLRVTSSRIPLQQAWRIDDVKDLTEKDDRFDGVILSHSLEHMPNPVEAVGCAMHLLNPGGHLFLAVPNVVQPVTLLGHLFKKHYVNRGHYYAWDKSHWMNFLEHRLGLNVIEYAADDVRLPGSRFLHLHAFEVWLAKFLPWWSMSNISVIKKD